MNDSLKIWFETGKVTDRKIIFVKQDKTIFEGLLQATSLYDENNNLIGSNTVIFNLTEMNDENILIIISNDFSKLFYSIKNLEIGFRISF